MFDYITGLINDFATWLYDLLMWWPKTIFNLLLEGLSEALLYTLDTVCGDTCTNAVSGISGSLGGIPPMVLYFADFFQLGYGLSMVLGAYTVRFLVRRIPIIG